MVSNDVVEFIHARITNVNTFMMTRHTIRVAESSRRTIARRKMKKCRKLSRK